MLGQSNTYFDRYTEVSLILLDKPRHLKSKWRSIYLICSNKKNGKFLLIIFNFSISLACWTSEVWKFPFSKAFARWFVVLDIESLLKYGCLLPPTTSTLYGVPLRKITLGGWVNVLVVRSLKNPFLWISIVVFFSWWLCWIPPPQIPRLLWPWRFLLVSGFRLLYSDLLYTASHATTGHCTINCYTES